jgi:hypothetical protein
MCLQAELNELRIAHAAELSAVKEDAAAMVVAAEGRGRRVRDNKEMLWEWGGVGPCVASAFLNRCCLVVGLS